MSDQDRISPYYINTISNRQVMRIKKILIRELLVDLETNITRTIWQTVRRIANEILEDKGLQGLGFVINMFK